MQLDIHIVRFDAPGLTQAGLHGSHRVAFGPVDDLARLEDEGAVGEVEGGGVLLDDEH